MKDNLPRPQAGQDISAPGFTGFAETSTVPGDRPLGSKPLAAYRLGRGSFDLWLWHNAFWAMPGEESIWHNVPLAVERLRNDRLVLADSIHQNVFAELHHVLDDLVHMADVLLAAWREGGGYGGREFGSRIVPGRRHWEELRLLVSRALDPDHPLRGIHDLGEAVGEYQLKLWEHGLGSGHPPEMDTVPDIRPLASRARKLPSDVLRRISQLESFVEHDTASEGADREAYLIEYLDQHPEASRLYCRGQTIDIPIARQLVDWLDACIEDVLRSMSDITKRPTPFWDSEYRSLMFEGKVVRHVKRGTDIEVVLAAFQKQKWSEPLPHPFLPNPNTSPSKIHELINSLNSGLVAIKFHADGTGCGICWGPAPDPGTP